MIIRGFDGSEKVLDYWFALEFSWQYRQASSLKKLRFTYPAALPRCQIDALLLAGWIRNMLSVMMHMKGNSTGKRVLWENHFESHVNNIVLNDKCFDIFLQNMELYSNI